jgi:outer membrane protein assembly factor BamB
MRIGSVFALVLYLLRTQIGASDLVYLVEPLLKWQRTLPGGGSINGAYIAPNRNNLFVISSVCTVQALDPRTGESVWTYQPGNPSTCSGGVTFSDGVGTPYLTFIESTINLGPTPFST